MRDTLKRVIESPWIILVPVGVTLVALVVLAYKAATMDAVHQKIDSIKTELHEGVRERERIEKHLEFIDKKQATKKP